MYNDLGYFGNIWVRQSTLTNVGDTAGGHKHHFDHVTLLVSGKVSVEVEGKEPQEFIAPTFLIMRKDLKHKMTALVPNTAYYCVFALRDLDGEVIGDVYGAHNDPNPLSAAAVIEDVQTRAKIEAI